MFKKISFGFNDVKNRFYKEQSLLNQLLTKIILYLRNRPQNSGSVSQCKMRCVISVPV